MSLSPKRYHGIVIAFVEVEDNDNIQKIRQIPGKPIYVVGCGDSEDIESVHSLLTSKANCSQR
ncbi:OLC1v1003290C1 [Oldenlandia corymbosa var. corymbosa]|uniref:OLC1v1003290C1 n=1 Tax=Oldenlandia corymbosa var. corymbosa TaxID=529605 RepID=A0AAV1DBK9_OLDCO|nr:OLC1v1003290C1 [Oldenlandia corymbosa var. corymbosa]